MKEGAAPSVEVVTSRVQVVHLTVMKMRNPQKVKRARRSSRPSLHFHDMVFSKPCLRCLNLSSSYIGLFPLYCSFFFLLFLRKWNRARHDIPQCSPFPEQFQVSAKHRSHLYPQKNHFFPLFLQVSTLFAESCIRSLRAASLRNQVGIPFRSA